MNTHVKRGIPSPSPPSPATHVSAPSSSRPCSASTSQWKLSPTPYRQEVRSARLGHTRIKHQLGYLEVRYPRQETPGTLPDVAADAPGFRYTSPEPTPLLRAAFLDVASASHDRLGSYPRTLGTKDSWARAVCPRNHSPPHPTAKPAREPSLPTPRSRQQLLHSRAPHRNRCTLAPASCTKRRPSPPC